MSSRTRLTVGVLAVSLTAGGTALAMGSTGSAADAAVGSVAPTLRGTDIRGAPIDAARWRGQVLLVNVWASWCAPCREELPVLAAAAHRLGPQGLRIVGIDFRDRDSSAADLLRVLGAGDIPSLSDPDGRVGVDWGVFGVPESFLVDRAGVVRARRLGPVDPEWLRAQVEPLLASAGGRP
jgi:cytochrome c biogenesis protein CcmG, thiol:disulfide interchange protein DsbE